MGRPARHVDLQAQAVMLPRGVQRAVVRSHAQQPEFNRLAGRRRRQAASVDVVAVLVRADDDSTAVQLVVNGYLLGYLLSEDSAAFAPICDQLWERDHLYGACSACIVGGIYSARYEHPSGESSGSFIRTGKESPYELAIDLATPEKVTAFLGKGGYQSKAFDPNTLPQPIRDEAKQAQPKAVGCLIGVGLLLAVAGLLASSVR